MKIKISIIFLIVGLFRSLNATAQVNAPPIDSVLNARITRIEKSLAKNLPGNSHLVIVGLTTFGYSSTKSVNTDINGNTMPSKIDGFGTAGYYEFSPLFLWRHGKKVLLEFEPSFNRDGIGVNWAAISYFLVPNVILRGGYFVLPFGMYSKKLAAGWINKVATDPIGLPTAQDYGVGASGGMYLGSMKWNYDLAISNGFSLQSNGQLQNVNLGAKGNGQTFTGRFGILPLFDNSLEIGISGLTGGLANTNASFISPKVNMYAFDLNYVKNIKVFQLNIKSQYNSVSLNNQVYQDTTLAKADYTFTNTSSSGYGQIALRPIKLKNNYLKNFEVAFRYGIYNTPKNSYWASNNIQTDYGINYWISWRTVLRVTYEILESTSPEGVNLNIPYNRQKSSSVHLQFSIQL